MLRDVTVLYPPSLSPRDWARAHERGNAPGRVPYGLDKLSEHGIAVGYDSAPSAGRNPQQWAGIARPSRLRRSLGRQPGRAAIAWDEHMAVPLLARYAGSGQTLAAGVIWATDHLAAGNVGLRGRAIRRVLQQMDLIWCLSRGQLPLLRSWLDVDPERIAFLPFAIDTDFYEQKPWPDRPMVLSLGNDADRDIETLLAALELVHEARPDVRLVVQTRSEAAAPPGVELIESVPTGKLTSLYAQAAVVAVATRPNLHVSGMTVCLEAMAIGRPAVLSRTEGASDYILDSVTGYLATPSDPLDHARAILSVLNDPEHARQLGQNAREHVSANHNQSTMCRGLASLLFPEPHRAPDFVYP